ncbi:penicillin acylase family protein [Amycolatopsis sp. NPDC049688]|uniref:penicillin acylase family protein n=1 Tax=Amycolatopsis sp. NPDC049688 TaxID=3154733 RepID=UPI003425EBC7
MSPSRRKSTPRGRLGLHSASLAGALALAVVVLQVSVAGAGTLPPLGAAVNPGTGVWVTAGQGNPPHDQTLSLPGLSGSATVAFEADGTAHIAAGTDADMYRALGYTHARFRLFEMDLARRQAEGRLAETTGDPAALNSDKYELDLGLLRAAQRDWTAMAAGSPARAVLTEYADGVNAAIAQLKQDNALPLYYKLMDFPVEQWTPVDSLAVQRLETQTLSFDPLPTAFSYIAGAFGEQKFEELYHAVGQNPQYPYDPGPYRKLPLTPIPARNDGAPTPPAGTTGGGGTPQAPSGGAAPSDGFAAGTSPQAIEASAQFQDRIAQLPANAVHTIGNSNAWVVSGQHTASGKPILASDPHLNLTVPSIWYQVELRSPGYQLAGVTVPGIPAVLGGKNQHISWGLTNSQRPGTFYYLEKTDAAHPDQYFWNGQWRPMTKIVNKIKQHDGSTVEYPTRMTVHGPVMTVQGVTAAVWFTGTLPSDNFDSMLALEKATSFDQFHQALRGWNTPAQNFAYADDAGNIGIVNAGLQAQTPEGCLPFLPMSGTGECDVTGSIPFEALPSTYNPPSGFAQTANQREVGTDYPYYYGRGYDFFDQGWRSTEITKALTGTTGVTSQQMQDLQMSMVDDVARALLPTVLKDLQAGSWDPVQAQALEALKNWDYTLTADSAAATVWGRFMVLYGYAVWHPVWQQYKIPAPPRDVFTPRTNDSTYAVDGLNGLLINLSIGDPANPLFAPPGAGTRTAPEVMRKAFAAAVADLQGKRGPDVRTWKLGDGHKVMIASLLQSPVLDLGPFASGGSGRTINSVVSAAPVRHGKPLTGVAVGGASWRMVVDWGTGQSVGIYPGGQSENPASPWYSDRLADWFAGRNRPILEGEPALAATKGRTWTLNP